MHGRVALGSLGMQAAYRGEQLDTPTRQARTSPKPPNPPWRAEPNTAYTAWRRVRLFSEHALGGMQRSNPRSRG